LKEGVDNSELNSVAAQDLGLNRRPERHRLLGLERGLDLRRSANQGGTGMTEGLSENGRALPPPLAGARACSSLAWA
jgi:hypothetical protein